jgi:predicted acyltransferase
MAKTAAKISEVLGPDRLVSLDVFRGITIAGMILVNNPGDWSTIYPPLQHAAWHGLTPTDLIFPFFLFIVGVAISLVLRKRVEQEKPRQIYQKIFRRFAIIFLFGLLLNAFPFFDFSTLRIPGVLQRIAVCYLVVSLIALHTNWKRQTIIAAALLIVYWILMTTISVPKCEITSIGDKACNLTAYLDRLILGENHIWLLGKVYDPEGILSTIPAIATTISGVLTGTWLRSNRNRLEKVSGIFSVGLILLTIGWIWSFWFPLNKALWTSSYVVYTSGLALCFLGFCIWVIDIKGYKKWSKPFVVFGMNALALYMGAELLARILDVIKFNNAAGELVSLKAWIYSTVFLPLASPVNASLIYAVSFILGWLFVLWILYRKRIFIKV